MEARDAAAPAALADLTRDLARVAATAPPQLAALAAWVLERPDEIAFRSVRQLAAAAGCNANTVMRLAQALGYGGFEPMQRAVQAAMRGDRAAQYAQRAAALSRRPAQGHRPDMQASAHDNIDALYAGPVDQQIDRCVGALLAARRVHVLGVRSCYAVAHYLSYTGAAAFPNFQPTPAQPGLIVDALSDCTPEDVVVAISYAHYSAEVVRGCDIARACGARLVALTDSYRSPLARGAWEVFRLPMEGPQLMPSLLAAFHLCELLLAGMSARDAGTEARLRAFEERLRRFGGYVG